ncbi:MAG: acyltransferase [Chitinophagaceae bacterium]|nr:acyltransferase [Chitinophagaceae bacterium]
MFYQFKYFFYRIRLNLRKIKAYFLLGKFSVAILDNVSIKSKPLKSVIGNNVIFYDNCILEIHPTATLYIGNNCTFSYGVVFSAFQEIIIGNDVMIGEYSSIRDTTHQYNIRDKSMVFGNDTSIPIKIGNNVWIGRGCLIMPGTIIEDGVVVAANSLVKGTLKANSIYGGNPAKFIKNRI